MLGWAKGMMTFVWVIAFIAYAKASEIDTLKALECGLVEPVPASFSLSVSQHKQTILIIGSSSTSGVGAGDKSNAYPARTAFHLNQMSALPPVEIIAHGIGGERAKAAVGRLAKAIKTTNPDILVWQVGTNDALGKIPLHELHQTMKDGLAIAKTHNLPVILIDPQFFPRILNNGNYRKTVDLIARTGVENMLPVIKRYDRMKRALTINETIMTTLLARDRFHMSKLGHECLAKDLAAMLTQGFKNKSTSTASNQ